MDNYENCTKWEQKQIREKVRDLYYKEHEENVFEIQIRIVREFLVWVNAYTIDLMLDDRTGSLTYAKS